MVATAVLAATLVASTVLATLKPAPLVEVAGRDVRLSDVADLRGVDRATAAKLGSAIIARLPASGASLSLSRAGVQTLAQRAVPALRFAGSPDGSITFRAPPVTQDDGARTCAEVSAPIAAGRALSIDDIAETECSDVRALAQIRFSRTDGLTYAADDLKLGDYLAALRLAPRPAIARGQQMTLRSAVGPVVIERPVTAMQAANGSGRIFVRSPEGDVFAAPVSQEAPQ